MWSENSTDESEREEEEYEHLRTRHSIMLRSATHETGTTLEYSFHGAYLEQNGSDSVKHSLQTTQLYFVGFGPTLTEHHIYTFLAEFGPIQSFRFYIDPLTEISLQAASVRYFHARDASRALDAASDGMVYLANVWTPEVTLVADPLGHIAKSAYEAHTRQPCPPLVPLPEADDRLPVSGRLVSSCLDGACSALHYPVCETMEGRPTCEGQQESRCLTQEGNSLLAQERCESANSLHLRSEAMNNRNRMPDGGWNDGDSLHVQNRRGSERHWQSVSGSIVHREAAAPRDVRHEGYLDSGKDIAWSNTAGRSFLSTPTPLQLDVAAEEGRVAVAKTALEARRGPLPTQRAIGHTQAASSAEMAEVPTPTIFIDECSHSFGAPRRIPRLQPKPVVHRRLPRSLWIGDQHSVSPITAGWPTLQEQFSGWEDTIS